MFFLFTAQLHSTSSNWYEASPSQASLHPSHMVSMTTIVRAVLCMQTLITINSDTHVSSLSYYCHLIITVLFRLSTFSSTCFSLLSPGTWCSPQSTGSRPPPCSGCSLTRVDKDRAVLFGGMWLDRLVPNHIHILNLQSWVCDVYRCPLSELHLFLFSSRVCQYCSNYSLCCGQVSENMWLSYHGNLLFHG